MIGAGASQDWFRIGNVERVLDLLCLLEDLVDRVSGAAPGLDLDEDLLVLLYLITVRQDNLLTLCPNGTSPRNMSVGVTFLLVSFLAFFRSGCLSFEPVSFSSIETDN